MGNENIKIELDERLSHLTETEVNNLISRYYNNEKAKDLIQEYSISITPSKLYTIFPAIICEDKKCPQCDKNMLIKRTPKSTRYSDNSAYCIYCGHADTIICNCAYCDYQRRAQRLRRQQEEENLIKKKKALIHKAYDINKYEKVKLEDLSFTGRVYLGALLRLALSEDMKVIKSLDDVDRELGPTLDYTKTLLQVLTVSGIIVVSPESPVEAFPDSSEDDEFPKTYYISKVTYILNVHLNENTENQIAEIINPSELRNEDKQEALYIWNRIALEECLEYLCYELNKVKFDFAIGEKTVTVLKDLLEHFSVSQIFGIIYKGIANATKYYQESNISKKQAANSVIGNCQRYGERALIEKWDLAKFRRPYELPQSMISEFFFNRILRIGNLGFDKPPTEL